MNIAVIGSGHVGGTLAKRFAEKNHSVIVGVRNPQDEKAQDLASNNIKIQTVSDAAKNADVIVIAIPGGAGAETAKELGDLSGKIVIDATNAIGNKPDPYQTTADAVIALCNTKDVVKCFNTTGFNNMANPDYNGIPIDMFVAGDSEKAKETAANLAQEIGFGEVYVVGGNNAFALLEQMAMVWISLAKNGYGREIGFKILKRN